MKTLTIKNPVPATSESISADFITSKELLRRLGIVRKTAWNWERAGKLPVVKIFHTKRYHWASVEAALLRQQSVGDL
jgi:predicted DNA-binding transcriptional regulator AlpA